ncbi:MAG TPA: DNA-directed RNA polymerase subunit omega [Ignavibacteriaceae bacterium]|nr:DNA-directed RNA polymerase subunit omega [Ignavibacteriaceae bacterium]
MNIEPVDLRAIDKRTANVYEAVIVASKRARQINDEQKIEFNALVGTIVPPATNEEEGEDIQNPAQLKIALELENREKPQIQAIKELLDDKVAYDYKK